MSTIKDALTPFHPLIKEWFETELGQPTDVQAKAWPEIALGRHVLATAPTGSGKTLTAFLWALNQLISGEWELGQTRVLYISPLKALNNDIQRNLIHPLEALKQKFEKTGEAFPDIRVQTRSGDTSQTDRRRMLRNPPEILITTPESLNLLLSSVHGRQMLTGLKSVILDEIHGVIAGRRGTYLMTAVDRLVPLAGEFQRVALSATVKPLETVAAFVGGFIREGERYVPREVVQIDSAIQKEYKLSVFFPAGTDERGSDETLWEPLVEQFKDIIEKNTSTLFFVNNRRLCEKLAFKINFKQPAPLAYAHHGSLSREIREEVESKLKAGELKAIIATNSLEMGIDIGSLDEVVLVQAPPGIASAIQRIGRAGHQVGEASRGTLIPTHSRDFLESAVLAKNIRSRNIEPLKPLDAPLDVLAQVLLSMVGVEGWNLDELYDFIRTSYPYRNLGRKEFDLVLEMLAGRYADSRLRELKPRISIDRLDNTARARPGALMALYLSGGVIPDRGYFNLRHEKSNARIGELDEEFVWEARIGQNFALGAQSWKIQKITHNDVFVVPAPKDGNNFPFWIAEDNSRDFHFSEAIADFLEVAENNLTSKEWTKHLSEELQLNDVSVQQLLDFLKRQKERTGHALPHRHHILVEHVNSGPGTQEGNQVVIHTGWGGKVNRPYAMALDAAWEKRFGHRLEVYVSNDCVVLMVPSEVSTAELLSLVTSSNVRDLIRKRLEGSGFFGARFRECAGRALLVTRSRANQRMPLWMNRLKSQKLMESIMQYEDFPILLETWRTCFRDEFDMLHLQQVLEEFEAGIIRWSECSLEMSSPFAANAAWRQINQYMYERDDPSVDKSSKLNKDLLREVVFDSGLRLPIPKAIIEGFERKRQRLFFGYVPSTSLELLDWLVERILIPEVEWKELEVAGEREGIQLGELYDEVGEKLCWCQVPHASQELRRASRCLGALENVSRISKVLGGNAQFFDASGASPMTLPLLEIEQEAMDVFGEWISFYGPVTKIQIQEKIGLSAEAIDAYVDDLIENERMVAGDLVEGVSDCFVCDAQNYEFLLRLKRAAAKPHFEPLPIEALGLFLADYQGLIKRALSLEDLYPLVEQFLCYPTGAALWEEEIFPARFAEYQPSWMDTAFQESDLRWFGWEGQKVGFGFDEDLELITSEGIVKENAGLEYLIPNGSKRDFAGLLQSFGGGSADLNDWIWNTVWEGSITSDSMVSLRKGILNKFTLPKDPPALSPNHPRYRSRSTGSRGKRWKGALPLAGNWQRLQRPEEEPGLIEQEEQKKERVRMLMDRYGILFRELLGKEFPGFKWAELFRTLRLMELSGEVLSGSFFEGIPGPQFISHEAFRKLQRKLPEKFIYWMNAQDPASLCGLGLEELKGKLPSRLATNHLVFRGTELVLESQRQGKVLAFHVEPNDPDLAEICGLFRHLLTRQFNPLKKIKVEAINGEGASRSPYLEALRLAVEVRINVDQVILERRY
jgi:ATP-dependent helicase Lhr and Lhr-like helicase